MKFQKHISILSVLLVVPLFAQQNQIQQLERAEQTIAAADSSFDQNQAEVLDSVDKPEAPALPEEPVFEVPSDQVFLDLPGGEESSSAVTVDAETISVDFPEEDVRDIIRSVAELYELNVVIPDSLAGSVSLKLRDVTWQQVFEVVLEPLNFTYITEGNIIKIKSRDELAVANASDIRGSISPLIDEAAGGKIQVDARSNALVITERPSRMNDIQEIIETLDRPTEQVMIESKFVEINKRDSAKLGVEWKSLDAWELGIGSEGTQGIEDGQIVNYENFMGDISLNSAVFSAGTFSTVISALDSLTNLELISNPTVVTLNNSPATITIADEYPIPSYQYNDERGVMEVNGFEYKPIGINMTVTPQINSAGFINLDILPEISSTNGFIKFGGGTGTAVDIPIVTTRKTQSKVTIKSGYTLAIGGLIEQTMEDGETRIPILGEIPVFGKLFSRDTKVADRSNLVIFITAKILSASGATYEDIFDEKDLYEMGVRTDDIPGLETDEAEIRKYREVMESRDKADELEKEYWMTKELDDLDREKWLKQKGIEDLEADIEERKAIRYR
jgi:type IV pilus assembly protein PilQ